MESSWDDIKSVDPIKDLGNLYKKVLETSKKPFKKPVFFLTTQEYKWMKDNSWIDNNYEYITYGNYNQKKEILIWNNC